MLIRSMIGLLVILMMCLRASSGDIPLLGPSARETYEKSRVDPLKQFFDPRSPSDAREAELLRRKVTAPFFFAPWSAGLAVAGTNVASILTPYFCGATIISKRWALTVAYCVEDVRPKDIVLFYGADSIEEATRVQIKKIIVHPEYKKGDFKNAIALLETDRELNIPRVLLSSLPRISTDQSLSPDDLETRVFGWGSLSEGGPLNSNLLQVDVSIVDKGICNSPVSYAGRISDDMLCAESRVHGIEVCQGFSGSGLVSVSREAHRLIGLVSWGEGCGRSNKPTVYTDVAYFRDWIEKYTAVSR
jgi:secreted trypsin-like serine protease